MRITIILPTLDEGPLLSKTVEESFAQLPKHDVRALFVTSARLTTKETRTELEKSKHAFPGRVESFDQIRPGVGSAIREAFDRAEGDAVIIMTPDMETPPVALPDIVEKLQQGYDVVATTRWRRGISFNGYNPIKLILNLIFQQLFRALYFTRLGDLTYGYRAFRISVVKNIVWEEDRHPFFFETILKPLRLGYKIAEVDVPWDIFAVRKTSIGRATLKDFFVYVWTGLRNRFLPKSRIRRQV